MLAAIVREFRRHELLLHASAIAYRVLLVTIPALLFVTGLLGALQLEELWRDEAAPELRGSVSQPVFAVIDDAVSRVLEGGHVFWVTAGALLALAGMASVVDAVTRTLNRIHGRSESRPFRERALNAIAIGALAGALLLAAVAVVLAGQFGFDALLGDGFAARALSFVVRWAVAAALLTALVVVLVRVAPDQRRGLRRVSRGALVVVGLWVAMSLLFGFYLSAVADYGSIFGHLATVYIFIQYVALSAVAFVGGIVLDSIAPPGGRSAQG